MGDDINSGRFILQNEIRRRLQLVRDTDRQNDKEMRNDYELCEQTNGQSKKTLYKDGNISL